ncbi:MAG: bifunctional DNA-formamidopyrimidine glycosylase/DNA-(apurinic or apyrimidinic site) lyase [Rhodospirillales bacterium]|nr:bifunctional DNA-formamidopyrimidine glycosylase/DNA-(apurinic or apyrimidinic site) lyase [Alphaproteobacteria bacterium]MCB9986551.1 bifunctional DNA-formamidopyrimidine glycosylase/DNA-(apurinic or apyrimidinic site) lyase [Rhodospirillales bacterium]USO06914.1 MAG: bifunctional DNA-formamidopyrimidine glycosylase/DNA-(apurinic or apyrimidinic site) lyase [Rhodospirillales bacterium]
MPELPEVETVRRGLAPLITGHVIAQVTLRRGGLRHAFPAHFAETLEGARVTGLRRRGKCLLIDLDKNRVWMVHLGMSGSFRSVPDGQNFQPETHDHVVITFENGLRLAFNDPRRFGQMDMFPADAESTHRALATMGPEPLERGFTGAVLRAQLAGRRVAIKVALMDQHVVAGIGNIYACEALFRAGISPRRMAGRITAREADTLARSIRVVMRAALRSGGSSLRNHRQVDGSTGYFQHSFAVYGHANAPCAGCVCAGKNHVRAFTQSGRTTFYCPVKQR